MTQSRKQVWIEVVLVALALAVGGMMLYTLLPMISTPDQQLVPPPPTMDFWQTALMVFVAATAIGAPVTIGIVLVILAKLVYKRVPASSSVAPEISSAKPKVRPAQEPKEMSPREATMWKGVATVLLLLIGTGTLLLLASVFTQFYH